MTVALRAMARSDVATVAAIERFVQGRDAWESERFHEALDLSPATYVCRIAADEDAGLPVAYGILSVAGPPAGIQAEIQNLAVAPGHQRRGIGSLVLVDLLDIARARDAAEVFLDVRADNDAAIALYTAFAFVEVARRRRYYASGLDALVMRLSLGAQGNSASSGVTPRG